MKQFSIALALIFITALGLLVLADRLLLLVFLGFVGISVATYLAYWWDKSAARNGRWRTPESTLHILALAGGWPGALIAQQVLRHKTQKRAFRLVFWLTVLVNMAVLVWVISQR